MPVNISLKPEIIARGHQIAVNMSKTLSLLETLRWPPISQTTDNPIGVKGAGY